VGLYHFSEDPGIEVFVPRSPLKLPERPFGRDWLNGPLVWAIDDAHAFLYLFPRDCPRILAFATPATTAGDREAFLGKQRVVAFVETRWLERISATALWRYELPAESFEDLADAGMHVSRSPVRPIAVDLVMDLPARLLAEGVEVRDLPVLTPLRDLWNTSLHVSGIRLRNAIGWSVD
jgi:hypothetical protein